LDAGYRARFGELDYNVEDELARFKVGHCFLRSGMSTDEIILTCSGIPETLGPLRCRSIGFLPKVQGLSEHPGRGC
jgi:hypothetical protein